MQRLFSKTWEAFYEELGRREPADEIASLLTSMRQELVDARTILKELDESITRARGEVERELAEVAKCERRGEMATRIGDDETARLAAEFAAKHRQRAAVQQKKLDALVAERSMRSAEEDEMKRRYVEADRNRFALLAQLRRTQAKRTVDGSGGDDDPFAIFSRIEDTVSGNAAYADALEDLSDEPPPPAGPSEAELDERLRELKRRMGET